MDLLFSRYANPFLLLDSVLMSGGLSDFIVDFWELHDEEVTWQVWLHKVHDKSFDDFKQSLARSPRMSEEQLETIVGDSQSLLEGFVPVK